MDSKKFAGRCLGFVAVMGFFMFFLGSALYSAQVVRGSEYSALSQRKIPEEETVEVARGEILDRYGRVLVSNQVAYQVTLNTSVMGTTQERNAILTQLVHIAQEEGMEWQDNLPVTDVSPYGYTQHNVFFYNAENEEGESYPVLTRLGKLAVKMKWLEESPQENPNMVLPNAEELLARMGETFGLETEDPAEIRALCGILYEIYLRSQDIYWVPYIFMEQVDIGFTVKVKENALQGVEVDPVTMREYSTEYAAHLLGRVGLMNETEQNYYLALDAGYEADDSVGKEGAELAFESYLRGESGLRIIERNTTGSIMSSQWETEPIPGGNVVLTLDIDLQKKVEDTMAEQIPEMSNSDRIQGAACVLVEVDGGGVLAAGSYPTFNLATYGEDYAQNATDPLRPLYNRALQGTYAPGSIFKMVTGIAALEEGIVEPSTKIRDAGRFDYYGANGPACWIYNQYSGSHGLQDVAAAIKNSCNYYFYDVGRKLGITRLSAYATGFGLGVSTGVELPESSGVMAGPEYTEAMGGTWYDGATLSVAIGQESSQFTPLQMANYIATLVNGGTNYSAHFLKEVKSSDFTTTTYSYEPEIRNQLDIEEENMNAVKQGMLDLIQTGSVAKDFQKLRAMGIDVGAKTGTAQLTSLSSGTANAVFVCFAPYENPEVALAIVVEKGGSGGEAASMAAEILEYYFTSKENRDEIQKEYAIIP